MARKSFLFVAVALLAAAGLAYTAAHKDHGSMVAFDEVAWAPIEGTPLSVAVLRGDPSTGANVRLLKLPAGFVAPNHAHTGDYHGVNLTGTWKHTFIETGEARELPPGSYVFQPGGEMHGDACVGPEDCVLMLQQSVAADFIPQEQ
jgi:quercetin dioxygenase-like cupin family protein